MRHWLVRVNSVMKLIVYGRVLPLIILLTTLQRVTKHNNRGIVGSIFKSNNTDSCIRKRLVPTMSRHLLVVYRKVLISNFLGDN